MLLAAWVLICSLTIEVRCQVLSPLAILKIHFLREIPLNTHMHLEWSADVPTRRTDTLCASSRYEIFIINGRNWFINGQYYKTFSSYNL